MAETDGQASTAPQTTSGPETSQAAPGSETAPAQTTSTGSVAEDYFFDPESIKDKPELMAGWKQLQGAYTKKTTELAKNKPKLEAYDRFIANPVQAMQELATQYGFKLTKAEAQAMVNEQPNKFEPQSWDEVIAKAKQETRQEVLKELAPFLNEVKQTRQSQVEKMLDESCPDWRVYEDKMMENLQKHPTLVNDPVMLYQLSAPREVLESRATQAALKRLQDKASSAQLSGGSSTNQQASERPKGKMSFDESVKWAKAKLAAEGKSPH